MHPRQAGAGECRKYRKNKKDILIPKGIDILKGICYTILDRLITYSIRSDEKEVFTMIAKDVVKEIMSLRRWSQNKLAEEAGFKSQSNVTGILNRHSTMKVDSLVQMVEAMGCEVIVRDKMGSKQEWKITDGKEE